MSYTMQVFRVLTRDGSRLDVRYQETRRGPYRLPGRTHLYNVHVVPRHETERHGATQRRSDVA